MDLVGDKGRTGNTTILISLHQTWKKSKSVPKRHFVRKKCPPKSAHIEIVTSHDKSMFSFFFYMYLGNKLGPWKINQSTVLP